MPSHAAANSEIKQFYINGHFCYAYKFGIITNGLGIIRHLAFYDKDFFDAHDIKTEKKSDSLDEDKSVHDARLLIPTLVDFFKKHPVINPKTFVCPKIKWEKNHVTGKYARVCHCDDPCTISSCGRMVYIYPEKDLRAYPGTLRGTEEWDTTYKIRTAIERDINHIKENLCLAGRRTQNRKTLHADLILAGITQLITVVLADRIQHHEYIRSIKPLIA